MNMSDCLFCKIVCGDIPAKVAYENNDVIAFHDINPQAPTHILIIPKKHIATLNDINDAIDDTLLMGKLMRTAQQLAREYGFADDGYRIVMNCNPHGGQEVYHIHLHLPVCHDMRLRCCTQLH